RRRLETASAASEMPGLRTAWACAENPQNLASTPSGPLDDTIVTALALAVTIPHLSAYSSMSGPNSPILGCGRTFWGAFPSIIVDSVLTTSRIRSEFRQTSVALPETLRIALDTLRAHKLRTFLTLLGVILAVATLVAVMSILNGLNRYVA